MNGTQNEPILQDRRRKNWFWEYNDIFSSDLASNSKLVRLYLARCANGERQAWPSLNTISKHCGISKPTVIKSLKELEEKGWLKRIVRKRPNLEYETTIYFLEDPPASNINLTTEGGSKGALPPVKNNTTRGVVKHLNNPVKNIEGVVKEVDKGVVKEIDNVVKQVDSNNTNIYCCCCNTAETENGRSGNVAVCQNQEVASSETNTMAEILTAIKEATGVELSREFVAGLLKNFPVECITDKLVMLTEYCRKNKVKNLPGLITKALQEDWQQVPGAVSTCSSRDRPLSKNKNNKNEKKRAIMRSLYMS